MKNMIKTGIFLFVCFSALPSYSIAGEATNQVKQTVDAVLDVLKNKTLKEPT